MDIAQQKQLQMWQKTNYPAQVEQIKKAGLNTGLLYGMGGTGGSTPGNASVPQPAERKNPMGMMDAAQLALLQAQTANINADTQNKKASATYTSGAQTSKTEAETGYIGGPQTNKTEAETGYIKGPQTTKTETEIENVNTKTEGERISNKIREIEALVAHTSMNDAIQIISNTAKKTAGEAESAAASGEINQKTKEYRIKQETMALATTALQQALMRRNINLTEAETRATAEGIIQRTYENVTSRMNAMSNSTNASTAQAAQFLNKEIHNISDETKLNYEWTEQIIKGILFPLGLGMLKTPNQKPNAKPVTDKTGRPQPTGWTDTLK